MEIQNSIINDYNHIGYVGVKNTSPLRLSILSDQQLAILKCLYFSRKALSQIEVEKYYNSKIHENTIRKAFKIFFNAGLLDYVPSPLKRYKFYLINDLGCNEFETQLRLRKTPLKW